jgi:predicted transposase YbfD/YdcC
MLLNKITKQSNLKKGMNMSNIPVSSLHDNPRLATLFDSLHQVEDPRSRNIKHPLVSILFIAICATVGGANDFVAIEQFGIAHMDWFVQLIQLPFGIPSHDTFNRIFSLICNVQLNSLLLLWLADCNATFDEQISIDAKTVKAQSSGCPLTILRAWSSKNSSVLAQMKVNQCTNEISVIPKLLALLDLKGKVVTIDAIGTQKKIVDQIVEGGGEYLLPVKGNQGTLHQDLKVFLDDLSDGAFDHHVGYTYHETIEKGHGRIEIRRCWATDCVGWIQQKREWEKLTSIALIEVKIIKKGKVSCGRRYFISSLSADAQRILATVRNHWSIENQLHWSLDTTLEEDKSTVRKWHAPLNIATIKSVAFSLLKKMDSNLGIQAKRKWANCHFYTLLSILINPGKSLN